MQRDVRFVLCPHNAHRMYLASVLLAAKLMDDNVFNNPYWAKVILLAAQALCLNLLSRASCFVCRHSITHRIHLLCPGHVS